jgi:iduronate 2-sulfatase
MGDKMKYLGLLWICLLSGIWTVAAAERPNVLLILVDDLRPELGCYGAEYVQSPNIDRLAEQGVVFERAYCQQAHCASSRFSMLSGCRPDTAGIWTNDDVREDLKDKTFYPASFREQGYFTVGLGKIAHNNWEDPSCWTEPHRMPENYSYEYRTRAGQALVKRMQKEALAAGLPDPFEGIAANIRRGMPYDSLDVEDSELGDGQLADEAIAALRRVGKGPFLLGVGFRF